MLRAGVHFKMLKNTNFTKHIMAWCSHQGISLEETTWWHGSQESLGEVAIHQTERIGTDAVASSIALDRVSLFARATAASLALLAASPRGQST